MDGLFYVENLFRDEQKKVKKRKKSAKATKLSFALDDEAEDADSLSGSATPNAGTNSENHRKKFRKNPAVDTSFLPDRDREEAERREREALRQQWLKRQEDMKKEEIEITYSYWDGSGHRKSVVVSLVDPSVPAELPVAHLARRSRRVMISRPFSRNVGNNSLNSEGLASTISCTLRSVKPSQYLVSLGSLSTCRRILSYHKYVCRISHRALLIPVRQHHTFYDFIINKARGKSGPLFNFDVHDDVRLLADATREKDESHAGKVVERSWYQRNKHIFPASRWEVSPPVHHTHPRVKSLTHYAICRARSNWWVGGSGV